MNIMSSSQHLDTSKAPSLWCIQWKHCSCGMFNGNTVLVVFSMEKKYYCGFSNSGNAGRSLNQGKKREWRVRELNWGDSEMEELFYCNEVGRDIRRVSGRKMENSCGPWGFITVGEGKRPGVEWGKGVGQSWERRMVWWKNGTKRKGTT